MNKTQPTPPPPPRIDVVQLSTGEVIRAIGNFMAMSSGLALLVLASNGEVRPHDTQTAIFGAAMLIVSALWRLK